MTPKKILCTFADSRLKRSLVRVRRQAESMSVYDQIFCFTEFDLDDQFFLKYKDRMIAGTRGFGYWIWKPQIILQVMERANEGDIIHWIDAGCWLNPNGRTRLLEYFDIVRESKDGLLGFQVRNDFNDQNLERYHLYEHTWTKGDLFDALGVRRDQDICETEQIETTTFFVTNNDIGRAVTQQWLSICSKLELADDSPSISPNFPSFIEHRHDQSILSLLYKKLGATTVSSFEFYYPTMNNTDDPRKSIPDWSKLITFPVWAKRDKDLGTLGILRKRMQNLSNKIFYKIFKKPKKKIWI